MTDRRSTITDALTRELDRQDRQRGAHVDIDIARLAMAVDLALDHLPVHPDDPEGDGLAPRELNASNDA